MARSPSPLPQADFWCGRPVLVTGHTGFIGSWLTLALLYFGARVTGYADGVPTAPSLFELMDIGTRTEDVRGDIADAAAVVRAIEAARPSIVFHLAAQPLVRRAAREPFETYRANLLGTVALLDALRKSDGVAAAILMTTDKVYCNNEWEWAYRENDALGGHEPYGLSKAMAEMAIAQYRTGFFAENGRAPRLVSVRAGNVIGGGDWSDDRLVPDAARAWTRDDVLAIRAPDSSRPWQHVLDVVGSLLLLARHAAVDADLAHTTYNIGPEADAAVTVREIVDRLVECWGKGVRVAYAGENENACAVKESRTLMIDASRFRNTFGWRPKLPLASAIEWTCAWYRAHAQSPAEAMRITDEQLARYFA